MNIKWIGSPNYTEGRQGKKIDRIVCHWIVGTLSAADITFQNTTTNTSAHYGVGNNEIHQYVKEPSTAYHAGNWDMNLRSIGIEHQGGPNLPISNETYETSAQLIADICKRGGLTPSSTTIIPHRSVVATQCPGTLDVNRLINRAREIISTSPTPPVPTPVLDLRSTNSEVNKQSYQGVLGVQPTTDEDNNRKKQNILLQEEINDLLKNDKRAKEKWLKEWNVTTPDIATFSNHALIEELRRRIGG